MPQTIDTEEQARRNAIFRHDLRQSILHATPRHPATKVLATAAWYAEISNRVGAETSYQVEKILEPEGFRQNAEQEPNHRNKWHRYQIGSQSPQRNFVEKINKILPGSSRLINHELWKVLDLKKLPEGYPNEGFYKVNPEISRLMFKCNPFTGIYCRKPMGTRLLWSLKLNSGVDALACATLLFFEHFKNGRSKYIVEIANSIYCILAISCVNSHLNTVAGELFNIYRERIFSKVERNGCGYILDDFDFDWRIRELDRFASHLKNNYLIGWCDRKAQVRELTRILHGYYGIALKNALVMPFWPLQPSSKENEQNYKEMEKWNDYCIIGKEMLKNERYISSLPLSWPGWKEFDEILNSLKASMAADS